MWCVPAVVPVTVVLVALVSVPAVRGLVVSGLVKRIAVVCMLVALVDGPTVIDAVVLVVVV